MIGIKQEWDNKTPAIRLSDINKLTKISEWSSKFKKRSAIRLLYIYLENQNFRFKRIKSEKFLSCFG